jgi:hypothetical protein
MNVPRIRRTPQILLVAVLLGAATLVPILPRGGADVAHGAWRPTGTGWAVYATPGRGQSQIALPEEIKAPIAADGRHRGAEKPCST